MSTKLQIKNFLVPKNHVLSAKIIVCLPTFITGKNAPSKKAGDCDNFSKALMDSICKTLGIDDSIIFNLNIVKVYKELPKTVVELEWFPIERFHSTAEFISKNPTTGSELIETPRIEQKMLPKLKKTRSPSQTSRG
jgi:hypothetical protein